MGRRNGGLHPAADDTFPLLSEVAVPRGSPDPGDRRRVNVLGLEDGALWEQQPPPIPHSLWRSRLARCAALALLALLGLWLFLVRARS